MYPEVEFSQPTERMNKLFNGKILATCAFKLEGIQLRGIRILNKGTDKEPKPTVILPYFMTPDESYFYPCIISERYKEIILAEYKKYCISYFAGKLADICL